MEFSKIIVLSIIVFHILLTIFVGIIKSICGTDLEFLLNYSMPLAITVCGGYSIKAGVENYQKIKNTNDISNQGNGFEYDEINNDESPNI